MFRHILVPLAGPDDSRTLLPYVQRLARLTGAGVTLVHAVDLPSRRGGVARVSDAHARAAAAGEAQDFLARVAAPLASAGIAVFTAVAAGAAAPAIIEAAGAVDLIVMVAHRRDGWLHRPAGSTVDRVVWGAPVPVLLVPARRDGGRGAGPLRRILVPLDGSALAERALPPAWALARAASATVILLSAIDPIREVAGHSADLTGMSGLDLLQVADEQAHAYLRRVGDYLTADGLGVRAEVRFDSAARAILACSAAMAADLVVMSTHGRGGLARCCYGSVANAVLSQTTTPLLLVRADLPASHDARAVAVSRAAVAGRQPDAPSAA
jgi:nucleotide-binding universal stress UspA family protein